MSIYKEFLVASFGWAKSKALGLFPTKLHHLGPCLRSLFVPNYGRLATSSLFNHHQCHSGSVVTALQYLLHVEDATMASEVSFHLAATCYYSEAYSEAKACWLKQRTYDGGNKQDANYIISSVVTNPCPHLHYSRFDYTGQLIMDSRQWAGDASAQTLGLTLRPLVSPPSDSCAHTLWLFPPLLHCSSHPATVRSISDCSDGQLSLR